MMIERILIPKPQAFEERTLERKLARQKGTEYVDAVSLDLDDERRQQREEPKHPPAEEKAPSKEHHPIDVVV